YPYCLAYRRAPQAGFDVLPLGCEASKGELEGDSFERRIGAPSGSAFRPVGGKGEGERRYAFRPAPAKWRRACPIMGSIRMMTCAKEYTRWKTRQGHWAGPSAVSRPMMCAGGCRMN